MKIRQIELQTHLLEKLKHFYTEVLGLMLANERPGSFTLYIGESRLRFTSAADGEEPFYHFAFNIPENQLEEAFIWARERVQILQGADGTELFDFPNWNAHAFYFADPAGNILECIARHDLNNASDHQFSATSLECISEIGLPVQKPLAFCNRVASELGSPFFDRSTSSDQFAAMGDDNGLLIVVPLTKKWIPTDQLVQPHPVHVIVDGDRKAVVTEGGIRLQIGQALNN
jgi:catechol 2,3-dioxygenase-like lactoylglutathione lyase family enzyme